MNIWYLHHYSAPYEMAGLHRPFEFGEYFHKSGNKVTVFSSSYLHFAEENIIKDRRKFEEKEYDGIKTVFIRTRGYTTSGVNRVINMIQFATGIVGTYKYQIKAGNVPDIIIASSPHPLTVYAGLEIAKKLNIPCVCEVRDLWPEVFFFGGKIKINSLFGKVLSWGERHMYEKSNGIVFLKEGDHTYILERKWDTNQGGKIDMSKCYYVNNGVDIGLYDNRIISNILDDPDLFSDKFKVVYCGTIRPVNNVDMLLDVAKIIGEKVVILIYGKGSCLPDLEERVKNENISNVKLKGYIDNKYVPYILKHSNANILNYSGSNYNWKRGNSSNKLFEYLASGKPVISTVKMGYDLLEKYDCGISTEECNAQGIAKCIEQLMNIDKEKYDAMCRNARKAAEDFDISKLANYYCNILNEIKGKTK